MQAIELLLGAILTIEIIRLILSIIDSHKVHTANRQMVANYMKRHDQDVQLAKEGFEMSKDLSQAAIILGEVIQDLKR